MALIIEDGTGGNPSANSYSDVDSLRNYAQQRDIDLSAYNDSHCETLMVRAMDYLEAQRSKYQGQRTSNTQPLQWPRDNVTVEGQILANTDIPDELVSAQLVLAIEAKDHDLQPNQLPSDIGPVVRRKVEGAVEVEYANFGAMQSTVVFSKAEALLAPLYS